MFGFFKGSKERTPTFHADRVLDDALVEQTQAYFHSGHTLSGFSPEAKQAVVEDLRNRIAQIYSSADGRMELRRLLAEYVLLYAGLAVLSLTEEEVAVMEYGRNPYITGELHHHVRDATAFNDEMRAALKRGATDAELIALANTRSALMLYYANALNMVRIHRGDTALGLDWYRPFVEAMLVWEEDNMRERLGLRRVVPGDLHGLPYFQFLEMVLAGDVDPVGYWLERYPQLQLADRIAAL